MTPRDMRLVVDTGEDLTDLAARFPTVEVSHGRGGWLTAAAWRDERFDFWAFDRRCDRERAVALVGPVAIAGEVLTRTQRLAPRVPLREPWFARVLAAHRALHDLDKPLVRADHDHALDTWQWALRLEPEASAVVQLAALLHDIERLGSEAEIRIEHRAADYQAFKDAHARAGAELARGLLDRAGVPEAIGREVAAVIGVHERLGEDPALRTVSDADALSFFSLNSPGYLAYFGPEQTAKKVAYTLGRMTPRASRELAGVRVPGPIRLQLEHHRR